MVFQGRKSASGQPDGHRNFMKIKPAATVILIWNSTSDFI